MSSSLLTFTLHYVLLLLLGKTLETHGPKDTSRRHAGEGQCPLQQCSLLLIVAPTHPCAQI